MKKLTKPERRKIYEQALVELNPRDYNDALCLFHFNKHFPECLRQDCHYGCNGLEEFGTGQLKEFELFSDREDSTHEKWYSFEGNEERIFILQLCIEMTR